MGKSIRSHGTENNLSSDDHERDFDRIPKEKGEIRVIPGSNIVAPLGGAGQKSAARGFR
ncbi:MAG: hypothetical protein M5U34_09595 [Chloroflexi bacterium]|nr:hypothetical protein [Chloroflexota bacterium]